MKGSWGPSSDCKFVPAGVSWGFLQMCDAKCVLQVCRGCAGVGEGGRGKEGGGERNGRERGGEKVEWKGKGLLGGEGG